MYTHEVAALFETLVLPQGARDVSPWAGTRTYSPPWRLASEGQRRQSTRLCRGSRFLLGSRSRSRDSGPLASVHHETPANRPVLRLHLVTPAECGGPIVEVSIAKRTVVDKPDNHGSARTRTNYGVSQQAVRAPHSPHDRRLVIHHSHRSLGHGSPEASVIPARRVAFFSEAA